MKRGFSNTVVPVVAFLAAVVLCYVSGPIRHAIGRQAASCTGFFSCNGSFNGQPNLTVTQFAFSFTPINFTTTLSGTDNSTAFAHGHVKVFTVYSYVYPKKRDNNFVRQYETLFCNDESKGISCGTFGYTFPQLDCDQPTLLQRAFNQAPAPNPPGATEVNVAFKGCKPVSWTIDGDCNGTGFSNQLTGTLNLNKTGSGNSSNPPKPCK